MVIFSESLSIENARIVLLDVMEWTNGLIRLANDGFETFLMEEMLQYLVAVMLSSQTSGFSIERKMDIRKHFGAFAPEIDLIRCIYDNLLNFAVVGRVKMEPTQEVRSTIEHIILQSFSASQSRSHEEIYHVFHLLLTLEDDLFRIIASDNQAKTLNSRK